MKLKEINEYFEPSLYEMSNYVSKTTGLASGVKMWVREEPTGLPHSKYRIKIGHPQYGSAVFALWGDEPKQVAGNWEVSGKDLIKIQVLIKLTSNQIRQLIDGVIDSTELGLEFMRVKDQIEQI